MKKILILASLSMVAVALGQGTDVKETYLLICNPAAPEAPNSSPHTGPKFGYSLYVLQSQNAEVYVENRYSGGDDAKQTYYPVSHRGQGRGVVEISTPNRDAFRFRITKASGNDVTVLLSARVESAVEIGAPVSVRDVELQCTTPNLAALRSL